VKLPGAVLVLAVLLALAFLALAAFAATGRLFSLDYTVQALVQGGRHPVLEAPMRALTLLGSGYVLAGLAVPGWLLLRRAGHPLERALPALVAGGFLLNALTKWLVARPRPRLTQYGFPSGHALGAVIFFGAVIYVLWTVPISRGPRWAGTILSCLLIAAVAYSRLYLKVHWASDVAGGLTGGAAYLLFVLVALDRRRRPAAP
jgi:undecaprenyl-diphosphatase